MPDSRFWGLGCVRECPLSARSGHKESPATMGGALLVVKPLAPGHADTIELPILHQSSSISKNLIFHLKADEVLDAGNVDLLAINHPRFVFELPGCINGGALE